MTKKNVASIIGLVLLLAGLVFLVIGIVNGEPFYVWQKAIRICLECIGLG